jgi:sugar lactone lactonase YvrE
LPDIGESEKAWMLSLSLNRPMKGNATMRFYLKSLVTVLALMVSASPMASAADLIYVALDNNTIVKYDTTGNNGAVIAATVSLFANTNLNNPSGLAFDTSGNLFAANATGNSISKFNSAGSYVSGITTGLSGPSGLGIDSSGNIYAANSSNNTISKFNSSGALQATIGNSTQMNTPSGLAINSSGTIYVGTVYGSYISKYDSVTGSFIGNITGNISYPIGVAFDSSGYLYVANGPSEAFISKFDPSGNYVSRITTNLSYPGGITFDSAGNLYAANYDKTISKFDSNGNFLTSWSTGSAMPSYLAMQSVTVPEPSTYALAAIASGVMAVLARRRKAAKA